MARVRRSATRRWEPGCSATGTVSGEGPATLDQVFRRSGYCVAATRSAFASRSRRTHSVIGRSFAWSMSRTTCRSRGSTYDGRDGLGRRAGDRSGAAASRHEEQRGGLARAAPPRRMQQRARRLHCTTTRVSSRMDTSTNEVVLAARGLHGFAHGAVLRARRGRSCPVSERRL